MRPRHLIYDAMFDALGGVAVAAKLMGVPEGTARTWEQSPDRSGREMPVKNVIDIISLCASAETNAILQELAEELIRHFIDPAKRVLVSRDPVVEIERALIALRAAGYGNDRRGCHTCGGDLSIKGYMDCQPVFGCSKCGGVDKRELIR